MERRIEDYALIGDCQTAALVGTHGSIEWLCLPRFDSAACLSSLMGTRDHGHWQIAPEGDVRAVRRNYRQGTLVLETEFETATGVVAVIDFMPPRSGAADVFRIVEGRRGQVAMHMEFILRFDYGSIVPWVRRFEQGITAVAGPDCVRFRSPVELVNKDRRTTAAFTVDEGQRLAFDLTWSPAHQSAPPLVDAEQALLDTEKFWLAWSSRCTYQGEWRDAVLRSLITLKALTYEPTGGIVAAATTSLPEHFGGVRNWDYRYCWLRDATFTLIGLIRCGYLDEARAWRGWLLRACAGDPSQASIMYGVAGERRLPEMELPWLPGFHGSRPVRTGNGAWQQRQLDVYGEVLDAMHQCWKSGIEPDADGWLVERALVAFVTTAWREPDEGIWEVRGPRRHFTHSKIMAWVAMDRAVHAVEKFGMEGPVEAWRALRDTIHAEVCSRGFSTARHTFVQSYGSEDLDASLLMIPLVGFLPANDPRVIATVEAIERELTVDGLVSRYIPRPEVDGLPAGESSFLLCSFWLVDCLALMGRTADALRLFERLLAVRNDVGLLSESYDRGARRLAGNFPQAFSHIGLINSALYLAQGPTAATHIRES